LVAVYLKVIVGEVSHDSLAIFCSRDELGRLA